MHNKLPIKQIFLTGLRLPFDRHRQLLRLGWPAILLFLAPAFIPEIDEFARLTFAYVILAIFTGVLGVVGCHRVFILDLDTAQKTSTFRWGSRETGFIVNFLVVSFLSFLIVMPIVAGISFLYIDEIITDDSTGIKQILLEAGFMLPAYYLISRWSLILPSCAIDVQLNLSSAWKLSKHNSLRLFVLVGIIPVLTNLLFTHYLFFSESSMAHTLIENMTWMLVVVIEISFLSLSYEWLMKNYVTEE